ncbi:hypothetical protein B296_00014586 [Ensete ventricosum]|uniref:Uncharacterized protein n=1 Tax=Ensete ventricosum TaxID=4639 RepID=A0A426ZRA8_ENSVE|nr:hypothetical protein B296_00014586 [Ensete ventricosum]
MGLCCSDRGVGLHKLRVTEVAVRGNNRGRLKKRQRKQRIWQHRERRALATTEVATEIDSGIIARTPRIIALIPIDRNPYGSIMEKRG